MQSLYDAFGKKAYPRTTPIAIMSAQVAIYFESFKSYQWESARRESSSVFVDVERSCALVQDHISLCAQAWYLASLVGSSSSSHLGGTNRCVLLSTQLLVNGRYCDEAGHTGAALRAGRVALIDMYGDGRMAMNGDGRIARILEARIM